MGNSRQLLSVIDKLYDAVTDLEKWPVFLESAATLFNAQGTQIAHQDLVNQRMSFNIVQGYDWSVEHVQHYESLMGEDPRIPPFSSNPFKAIHCRTFLTDEELHESRVYKEVLAVGDVEYTLGVNLVEHDRALTYFLALRNRDQPPFSQEECELLEELIPHINRAVKLQKELSVPGFERDVALESLDSMALGVIVLDASSKVRMANETAKNIAAANDGLSFMGNRLLVSGHSANQFYRKVRQHLDANQSGKEMAGEAFQVERLSDQEPYSILVSTYQAKDNNNVSSSTDDPLVVLLIRDLDHPQETRTEILQRLYGLTPSQARLTNLLSNGLPLKEAASQLNLTGESARQYLKLIFQKTGTNRQAELVRKVILTPKAVRWGEIGL